MSRTYDAKNAALKAHPTNRKAAINLFLEYLNVSQDDFFHEENMTAEEYIFGNQAEDIADPQTAAKVADTDAKINNDVEMGRQALLKLATEMTTHGVNLQCFVTGAARGIAQMIGSTVRTPYVDEKIRAMTELMITEANFTNEILTKNGLKG